MESKYYTKNVPVFKIAKSVRSKVDKLVVLYFAIGISLLSFSQNQQKIDSLLKDFSSQKTTIDKVKTLQNLVEAYKYYDLNKTEYYAHKSLKLSKTTTDTLSIAGSLYQLGSLKKSMSYLDSSEYYFNNALKLWKLTDDKKWLASCYIGLSDVYRLEGDYDKSIAAINQSIVLSKSIKDTFSEALALGNLSSIYRNKGNYTLAYINIIKSQKLFEDIEGKTLYKADTYKSIGEIEYHRENYFEAIKNYKIALDVYKKENDYNFQGLTLNRIANTYISLKQYESAKTYATEALNLAIDKNFENVISSSEFLLGEINYETKNYKTADFLLNEALIKYRSSKNINSIYTALLVLGKTATKTKNYNAAKTYFNEGLLIADTINAPRESQEFYYYLSILNLEEKDYQNAHNNLKRYSIIKDSLSKVNNARDIAELKTIYETEKKEKEIALKAAEIKVLKQKEAIAKNRQILLGIIIFSIVLLASALFYGLRQKMKRNKVEREKLDASLQFKEKELTTHALHLAHKNEVLLDLKSQLKELKSGTDNSRSFQKVINAINLDINNDNNWEQFRTYFEDVHKDFNSKVKRTFPEVTSNDLRLMSLLKMNLSSKEIANILNISSEGVKKARYRLRKKLSLSTEESLQELIIEL